MDKAYIVSYINEEGNLTHFDHRGFKSYREATQMLLDEGHKVYAEPDMHTDNQEEFCETVFEFREDDIFWIARIGELEFE